MPSPPLLYGQRFQLYQRNIYLGCVHDNIKSDLCSFNQYCLHLLQSQFKNINVLHKCNVMGGLLL